MADDPKSIFAAACDFAVIMRVNGLETETAVAERLLGETDAHVVRLTGILRSLARIEAIEAGFYAWLAGCTFLATPGMSRIAADAGGPLAGESFKAALCICIAVLAGFLTHTVMKLLHSAWLLYGLGRVRRRVRWWRARIAKEQARRAAVHATAPTGTDH